MGLSTRTDDTPAAETSTFQSATGSIVRAPRCRSSGRGASDTGSIADSPSRRSVHTFAAPGGKRQNHRAKSRVQQATCQGQLMAI